MSRTTHKTILTPLLVAAYLAAPGVAPAVTPIQFSGAIGGIVSDSAGIPQLGATVSLFNRQERLFQKALTDERGEFRFLGLLPDVYSVRINLATYVPAFRKDIIVKPGTRSMLSVNLSSLFSTIQITYPVFENGNLMTDDWKWVLRGAAGTRPVLRLTGQTSSSGPHTSVFSDTRGLLKVSAGEGPLVTAIGTQADLGTAFAVATSLFGNNQVQVSGNLGYGSQTGVPSASFRTSYSRSLGVGGMPFGPEVSLTMRQLFLPARLSAALTGTDSALPMLRSMSASFEDHTQLTDGLSLRYGMTMDAVTFLDRLSYFSPFARLTYSMGDSGEVEFTYTSGNARPELGAQASSDSDLHSDLNSLALFPRISLRDNRPHIQRGQEFELSYSRKSGSRTYAVSAYREEVFNAALSLVAGDGLYSGGDILPDLFSGRSIFNAGNFQTTGMSASVSQQIGDHIEATLIYGSVGALSAQDRQLESNSPDELRAMIHASRKHAATARISATAPGAGTHMIASYQWSDNRRSAMPGNVYSTQSGRALPGLNLYIRQPLPRFAGLPWRMEATADLRNLLAEGYLPLNMASGQQILLVETPRSFRGGLNFIF
jgi:hypothetical protein